MSSQFRRLAFPILATIGISFLLLTIDLGGLDVLYAHMKDTNNYPREYPKWDGTRKPKDSFPITWRKKVGSNVFLIKNSRFHVP